MDTIKEGNLEQSRCCSSSNPVDRTRTSAWKKKRLSQLSTTQVYKFTSMHAYPYYLHRTYVRNLNANKMFNVYI